MRFKDIIGIIALVIGIIILLTPMIGLITMSLMSNIILLVLGCLFVFIGYKESKINNEYGILILILGILGLILGFYFIFNLSFLNILGIWIYILVGLFLVVNGCIYFIVKNNNLYSRKLTLISIILGILFIIIGILNLDPLYLGVILGIGIIFYGALSLKE
ncbi:MAG: DUF308 domain-containing protein [Methanobacteriaceae archaeon]|nr:DUF308 domain-containing protein [Methanobacteriaceae archaeon]